MSKESRNGQHGLTSPPRFGPFLSSHEISVQLTASRSVPLSSFTSGKLQGKPGPQVSLHIQDNLQFSLWGSLPFLHHALCQRVPRCFRSPGLEPRFPSLLA